MLYLRYLNHHPLPFKVEFIYKQNLLWRLYVHGDQNKNQGFM